MARKLFVDGEARNPLQLVDWGGSGPGVLMVHGMGAHSAWWDEVIPLLPSGLRVVTMDLRGHGDSAWVSPPAYSLDDYAADVECVRAALGWDRFALAAHSLGARVSLRYASARPERLFGLALFDFYAADWGGREPAGGARTQPTYGEESAILARFRLQPPGTTLTPEALTALARQGVKRGPDGRWGWKFDWNAVRQAVPWDPAEPSRAAVPALLVRGEHSTTMPRASFKAVLSALPDARGMEIPGAHHHVPLDAPRETADALGAFLGL
ncbi:MAG: alpha/beta hydrolase [Elusimicrobia bacterium]|nr:alpha/beta hydrolase [Elusimicrobiota bacterium]